MLAASALGSIPSPSFNTFDLGPLHFRMYGLMIVLGVIAAVLLSQARWKARGGDPADITAIATWAVPAGLIGARLYHLATDWRTYEGRWLDMLKVWQGGLGIPGGVIAGVLAGWWVARRRHLPVPDLLDVVAPALPLAQAIGRFGNWFNQELFGRPTSLPWGLEIDAAHRAELPARYATALTFHPTFLYEALWNLALVGVLIFIDSKRVLRRGNLFACYVLGYFLGRIWVESLRIDPASRVLGLRINEWTSGIAILGAITVLVVRRGPREPDAVPAVAADAGSARDDVAEGGAGRVSADEDLHGQG